MGYGRRAFSISFVFLAQSPRAMTRRKLPLRMLRHGDALCDSRFLHIGALRRIKACWPLHLGPRAGRRLAAMDYALNLDCMPFPSGWDWAARSLEFHAPDPLVRAIFRGTPQLPPAISQAAAQARAGPEIAVFLTWC